MSLRPDSLRHWFLAVSAALGLLGFTGAAFSDVIVINPNPHDRRFPQGVFCPLPVDLAFESISTEVDIHFSAEVYTQTSSGLVRCNQSIDNVVLVTEAAYQANLGALPSNAEFCYNGAPLTSTLHFQNVSPASLRLLELFDTDPAARGWDMTNGGFFQSSYSAVRDPSDENSNTGGSMGLGYDSPSPSLSDLATTSIHVAGLTPGEDYRLVTWWDVLDFEQELEVTLTISITAPDGTPLAKSTWGGMKRAYR